MPAYMIDNIGREPVPGADSVREAAATLGVSVDTVYRRVADGELASFRLGALIRIPASEIRQPRHREGARMTAAEKRLAKAIDAVDEARAALANAQAEVRNLAAPQADVDAAMTARSRSPLEAEQHPTSTTDVQRPAASLASARPRKPWQQRSRASSRNGKATETG